MSRKNGPAKNEPPLALKIQQRRNYSAKYTVKGTVILCYTKKQMKSLYPRGGFKTVAEYVPGRTKKKTGELRYKQTSLPLSEYGTGSRLLFREKLYVAVDKEEDRFVALLKNALLPRTAALAGLVALLVLGAVFLPQLWQKETQMIADEAISAGMPELDENAVDWEGAKTNNTNRTADSIEIPGFERLVFNADSTQINVNLYNPETNPCYFVINIYLEDGTLLYQSKMLEPGKALYSITLTQPLAEGEYSAFLRYDTYSLEDLSMMNGAKIKFDLIVR